MRTGEEARSLSHEIPCPVHERAPGFPGLVEAVICGRIARDVRIFCKREQAGGSFLVSSRWTPTATHKLCSCGTREADPERYLRYDTPIARCPYRTVLQDGTTTVAKVVSVWQQSRTGERENADVNHRPVGPGVRVEVVVCRVESDEDGGHDRGEERGSGDVGPGNGIGQRRGQRRGQRASRRNVQVPPSTAHESNVRTRQTRMKQRPVRAVHHRERNCREENETGKDARGEGEEVPQVARRPVEKTKVHGHDTNGDKASTNLQT